VLAFVLLQLASGLGFGSVYHYFSIAWRYLLPQQHCAFQYCEVMFIILLDEDNHLLVIFILSFCHRCMNSLDSKDLF